MYDRDGAAFNFSQELKILLAYRIYTYIIFDPDQRYSQKFRFRFKNGLGKYLCSKKKFV